MLRPSLLYFFLGLFIVLSACRKDPEIDSNSIEPPVTCEDVILDGSTSVLGFGILDHLPGIWNGPVNSPTALGNYPEWIVDFRPISPAQVSAKNELDSVNDIFMSYFLVKHDCTYKIAFRNGGGFAGNTRTSYMIVDSVSEDVNHAYYRFVDPVSGGNRVTTHVTFKEDSLIMHTLTNNYNTLSEPETHMIWKAKLKDSTSTADAINYFNFPQKTMVKDFSTTFDSLFEAVFYNDIGDPYPENEQPYVGISQVNITISNPATTDPAKKVLIIVSTQPLFSGMSFDPGQLNYRSRYVFVGAADPTGYSFNYMHPGNYYVNALYDSNGDFTFTNGDYINSSFDIPFSLSPESSSSVNVNINFQIP